VELRLLGPLEVVDDDGHPVELRGAKPNGLLALLALRVGEVVSVGRIVEELWGDQEVRDPLNAVQVVVSKLRRSLQPVPGLDGRAPIATSASGYRLDVAPESVDAVRFDRLVGEGRRQLTEGATADAAATLRAALDLWRGRALEDFHEEFARGDRLRLDELRLTALEFRIDADLALGRHDHVASELASLTAEHPLRERFRAQQMLALYRAGRQAEALHVYQDTRTVLGEELGLDPGFELQRLEAAILSVDPGLELAVAESHDGAAPAVAKRTGNLPVPISSFVGRGQELETVARLVRANRLVTIVGPGGAGKTRVALETARAMEADYQGGVWLVELAAVRDPLDVASAVASALGLDDPAHLDRFLADQAVLLIIDNCEHVVHGAATVIERALHAGADVRVLATSREHLDVAGEVRWTMPPLDPGDAAALFVERSHAGGLTTTENHTALIERICDRLDGLPLAVELAAARTRSLSLSDIVERIDDRFRLLTTGTRTAEPRQQTLRSVVDWSYDLLFTDEQRVFRRLSVFAGGFDLHAAEVVCAGDDVAAEDVVDILGHLVDKSLVTVVSRDDGTRYRLLQTLVDYGRARLVEADEAEATGERHLRWMVGFAAEAEPGLRGHEQPRWIRRLGLELDNARAALQWALDRGRTTDAVALAAGLAYGWYITGAVHEGQAFISRALAQEGESSAEHRAVALAWGGWLTQIGAGATADAVAYTERAVVTVRGRSARAFSTAAVVASLLRAYRGLTLEATELIEEADRALAEAPDRWGQAYVDWVRSGLALKLGDAERAGELLRDSVAGFSKEGDRYGEAIACIRLGELAELRGDYEEAIEATRFAYEGTMSTGPGANASILATRLGNLAALQNRFDDAASWHATALSRARQYAFPGPAAQALSGMGVAAGLKGDMDEAETLHREALAAYDAVGSIEGAAFTCACLGFLAANRGDAPAAIEWHQRSLAIAMLGSERRAMALAVVGLAGAHALEGDGQNTAQLLGVASELRGVGPTIAPWALAEQARIEASARSLLGDAAYDAAYASGRLNTDTNLAHLTAEP
jgi:predicted ATPase/DNA-binding SARP family transcriptional activator